ncbi:MAG: hypothetical protein M1383_02185 [Patescibacteria group bacterium]|nr:hypothetical protein [Patescibacteria group bacterium]
MNNIRDAEGWLKSYITDAVLTVQEIVKDPKHPHAHSMAMAVIRRCWGTPKQQYERREKERREQEEKEREEERRAHKFDGWSKQELESYIKTLQHQRKMQIISELREIIKSKDNQ